MSTPRSAPAELAGFTLLRGLGGGGFADVFLYRENHLDREVAVKILRAEHLSASSLRQFETEANVMARTSAHPYIVTIYNSGVAADGRPYIAMEYYPRDHFGLRARGGKLAVAEVLRVGVQVASAVETAHRAGIMHRDIKPANILTSEYGRPGLTDFGISGVRLDNQVEAASGVTVAFASPEVLGDEPGSGNELSDVYSLAATLYTLLAGRSPFWIAGGDNTDHSVFARALNGSPPALDRADMTQALNHLLRQGMAVDPSHRPQSALALARQLQDIEQQLSLAPTAIEVREADAPAAPMPAGAEGEDEGTRRALPKSVSPDGDNHATTARPSVRIASPPRPVIDNAPAGASTTTPAVAIGAAPISQWAAPAPADPHDDPVGNHATVARKPAPPAPVPVAVEKGRTPIIAGAAAVVAVLVIVGFLLTRPKDSTPVIEPAAPTTRPVTSELFVDTPDTPKGVTATVGADGRLTVVIPARTPGGPSGTTSSVPPEKQLTYRLIRTDHSGASWPSGQPILDAPGFAEPNGVTTVVVEGLKPGQLPCLKLSARTTNTISEPTAEICATMAQTGSGEVSVSP